MEWEQRLQRVAKEASEGSPPSPLTSYSSSYGESGDLDDPIQVVVAEPQKAESKGGWFSRAKKDRPKPARPTGVHGSSPYCDMLSVTMTQQMEHLYSSHSVYITEPRSHSDDDWLD